MVHTALRNYHPDKPIELVTADSAEKQNQRNYDHGLLAGAIVATAATSGRPFTLRGVATDVGIGAIIGAGAIAVGRIMDYFFWNKKSTPPADMPERIELTSVEPVEKDCNCPHRKWSDRLAGDPSDEHSR